MAVIGAVGFTSAVVQEADDPNRSFTAFAYPSADATVVYKRLPQDVTAGLTRQTPRPALNTRRAWVEYCGLAH